MQLCAVTSEGELHKYDAPTLTCDESAMPSHGELTLAEDLPTIAGLEERMAESYGHEMVWRTARALRIHATRTHATRTHALQASSMQCGVPLY